MAPLHDLGVATVGPRSVASTDHVSFDAVGLPGFQFMVDRLEYNSRTHHSNMDVFDRVQRDDMVQQATVIAVFAYTTAMRDEKLPRAEPARSPPRRGSALKEQPQSPAVFQRRRQIDERAPLPPAVLGVSSYTAKCRRRAGRAARRADIADDVAARERWPSRRPSAHARGARSSTEALRWIELVQRDAAGLAVEQFPRPSHRPRRAPACCAARGCPPRRAQPLRAGAMLVERSLHRLDVEAVDRRQEAAALQRAPLAGRRRTRRSWAARRRTGRRSTGQIIRLPGPGAAERRTRRRRGRGRRSARPALGR